MIRAISMYAGLVMLGLLAGALIATIFVMGWTLHVIGCAALVVLGVSLWLLDGTVGRLPYDRERARAQMICATVAAAVLAIVVLAI